MHSRQRHGRRWRLQINGRRQDLDASQLPRCARHLQNPHPSLRSERRLCGRVWAAESGERRTRRVQDHGRRQDVAARAVPRFENRRDRHLDRSPQPEHHLCRALGSVPHGIHDVERRPGQWIVQIDGRRRDVDGNHAQSWNAVGRRRQDRRVGVGRGSESSVRAR